MTQSVIIKKKRVKGALLYFLALVALQALTMAQRMPSKEDQVKCIFLFNFAQFTNWEAHAFPDPGSPFVIGVLGDDPFGDFLPQVVLGERIQGHTIEIKRYSSVEEIGICHVLFIHKSEAHHVESILNKLGGRNILTVSDIPDFTLKGGMIKTYVADDKVRFEVNMRAAEKTGLTLSSKLLRIADLCCDRD